jgi:hypothetical protein
VEKADVHSKGDMKRKFNVIDRGVAQVQGSTKIRESLPYIGFVRPSDFVTEEQAKQINSERSAQAFETHEGMKKAGYSPTLEGYFKKDGSFVSTQDAHRLCKDGVYKPEK